MLRAYFRSRVRTSLLRVVALLCYVPAGRNAVARVHLSVFVKYRSLRRSPSVQAR